VNKFTKKGWSFAGGSLFPNTGASIFVECPTEQELDSFVKTDPFFKNNLLVNYEIEELEILSKRTIQDISAGLKYNAL
jgi:hypothetical protein